MTFHVFCASTVAHNVGKTVVLKLQDSHVAFRANEALVAALAERARRAGCPTSEYLRALVREKVGL